MLTFIDEFQKIFAVPLVYLPLLLWPLFACRSGKVSQDFFFQEAIVRFPDRMTELTHRPAMRHLLERFRPRFFVAADSYRPLNFYEDYLPRCVAREIKTGDVVYESVDAPTLRRIARDDRTYLDFSVAAENLRLSPPAEFSPTVYSRVYRDTVGEREFLFLKYSPVFPYSGLPAELGWWRRAGAGLLGDSMAWHELDIHGAVHVVLDAPTHKPADPPTVRSKSTQRWRSYPPTTHCIPPTFRWAIVTICRVCPRFVIGTGRR